MDLISRTKKQSVEKILENKLGLWAHYIGTNKEQEEKIKKKFNNSLIAFGIVRLFIGYETIDWEETKISGIAVLIKEDSRQFLKIYDGKIKKSLFKCEIWNGFPYERIGDLFHAFKRKSVYYGLGFKNTKEADKFHEEITNSSRSSLLNESQKDLNTRERRRYQNRKDKQRRMTENLQRYNQNSQLKIPENWNEVLKLANISSMDLVDPKKTMKLIKQSYKDAKDIINSIKKSDKKPQMKCIPPPILNMDTFLELNSPKLRPPTMRDEMNTSDNNSKSNSDNTIDESTDENMKINKSNSSEEILKEKEDKPEIPPPFVKTKSKQLKIIKKSEEEMQLENIPMHVSLERKEPSLKKPSDRKFSTPNVGTNQINKRVPKMRKFSIQPKADSLSDLTNVVDINDLNDSPPIPITELNTPRYFPNIDIQQLRLANQNNQLDSSDEYNNLVALLLKDKMKKFILDSKIQDDSCELDLD